MKITTEPLKNPTNILYFKSSMLSHARLSLPFQFKALVSFRYGRVESLVAKMRVVQQTTFGTMVKERKEKERKEKKRKM